MATILSTWLERRRLSHALARLTRAHAARGTFSGAVDVIRRGRSVYRDAHGLADRASGALNTVETAYRIGSVAKTFTALAVLRLADQGKLAVGDPLARHLPGYPNGAALRLHHLLSNSSGIPDYLMLPEVQPHLARPHSTAEMMGYFRDLPLLFQPGERLSYSNSNWTLLAAIVEQVTGSPFGVALQSLVLGPLGLEHTCVDCGASRGAAAVGYTLVEDQVVPAASIHASVELGAGGLRSTIDDLLRLDRALAAPGFLEPDTWQAMTHAVSAEGELGYGYGLFLTTRFGRPLVGHSGGTFGFTAFWSRYPTEDVAIVVLANLDNGSAERLERDLGAIMLGQPYELPTERSFVAVPGEVLDRYVGRYRSQFAGRAIDFAIERRDADLFAVFPLLPRARLRALSDRRFFTRLKGGDVVFAFEGEGDRSTGIAVDWSGNAMHCPRIEPS
jgi:CubicO group peptidase (beta-lactamase class C family)